MVARDGQMRRARPALQERSSLSFWNVRSLPNLSNAVRSTILLPYGKETTGEARYAAARGKTRLSEASVNFFDEIAKLASAPAGGAAAARVVRENLKPMK